MVVLDRGVDHAETDARPHGTQRGADRLKCARLAQPGDVLADAQHHVNRMVTRVRRARAMSRVPALPAWLRARLLSGLWPGQCECQLLEVTTLDDRRHNRAVI